jgi:PAS domain S-box-containing protein
MLRLHIHTKLLVAFIIVLLPVLGLLVADSLSELRRTRGAILDAQLMTARAVAVQVDQTFEAAIGMGWAVAQDPLVQTLEPRLLDAHLQQLRQRSPLYDAIGVYDASGLNRGWGNLDAPAEPRLRIGDRPYFKKVMATNAPVISEVVELRRPTRMALLASVPIRDAQGRPIGVVNVVMEARQLAHRYLSARLQPGQVIFLADPNGRLAFHTGFPEFPYEQSSALVGFEPLQATREGTQTQLERFTDPFSGDEHLGAFVSTSNDRWTVGVTAPRDIALAPLFERMRFKLVAFTGILLLSILLAEVLTRFFTRSVRQLQMAAQALGRGELEQRVNIRTGDELEALGTAFNEMAAQVARREAEVNALRVEAEHQAHQFAAIIASVPDPILLASANGQLIDANPAGLRLLGFEDHQTMAQPLSEYLQRHDLRHPDGRPLRPEELPLNRALAGETFTEVELRMRGLDGTRYLLSINGAPVRDVSGRLQLGVVVIRDITRRRREEEELARLLDRELALARIGQALVSEVELARIADVAIEQSRHALGADAIGLWVAEPERRELSLIASHCLPASTRERLHHLAFTAPVLMARAALTEQEQLIEDTLAGGEPVLACAMARDEGFRGLVAVPLHSRGRLVGVMAYFTRDPLHLSSRELEFHTMVGRLFAVAIDKARLFQEVREALRLREEFMSAAAHELKTPVTTIQTWTELLLKMETLSPRKHKGLTAIARNTRRISRLVEHLFAAVRMAPGIPTLEHERFDLHELVLDRVEKMARTTENPILFEPASPIFVHADRQLLGEVVAHLLENAIRYSPPGGAIEIHAWRRGSEALVSVHDHGPGIPPERQPHVFEPLYEPLPPGAVGYTGVVGLGLHLSRQIVEAHGGHIWLVSSPELGSAFSFRIPLRAAQGEGALSAPGPEESSSAPGAR